MLKDNIKPQVKSLYLTQIQTFLTQGKTSLGRIFPRRRRFKPAAPRFLRGGHNPACRSEVLNTHVRVAFEHLAACMQDVKDRYYKSPPLLEENLGEPVPPNPP
jgi:hypothetical protein